MEGKIYISGLIGSYGSETGVELVDVISQVKKQPDATSFNVYIDSEGGVVSTGFDIYNYLRSLGLPITTVGSGLVASIATVIFMAGSTRIVREGTSFMIHLPMGRTAGTADQITEYAKTVKEVETKMLNFYVKEYGLQREAIEPLLMNETWLTEDQLRDLGITTAGAVANVAARAEIIIESKNNKKDEMSKNKDEKNILQKISAIINGIDIKDDTAVGKVLYDSKSNELKFPNVEEDAAIAIGDEATLLDRPADGDVRLQDGRVLTFEKGKLKAITEAENKEAELEAEIARLTAEVQSKDAEITTLTATVTEKVAEVKKHEAVMARLKKLQPDFDVDDEKSKDNDDRDDKKKSRFEAAVTNLKKK